MKDKIIKLINDECLIIDGSHFQDGKPKIEIPSYLPEMILKATNGSAAQLKDFFVWTSREADVDVIDAETAIELHGKDYSGEHFAPVVTVERMVELYLKSRANV